MRKLKTVIYLSFGVATTRLLETQERGRGFRELFSDLHPLLVPTHYGFSEPKWKAFDPERSEDQLKYVWQGTSDGTAMLQYRGKMKGSAYISAGRSPRRTSNILKMDLEYELLLKYGLLKECCELQRRLADWSDAEYAAMCVRTDWRGGGWYRDHVKERLECKGVEIPALGSPSLFLIGVPCPTWITMYGKNYLDYIGADLVMNAGAYSTVKDKAGRAWLQFTERPEEMYTPEWIEKCKTLIERFRIGGPNAKRGEFVRRRKYQDKEYEGPAFDLSELYKSPPDPDPYSTQDMRSSISLGRQRIYISRGFVRQISDKLELIVVTTTLLKLAIKKGEPVPFGMALAEDDEQVRVTVRKKQQWTMQDHADQVIERLIELRGQQSLKAVGGCYYGIGPVPGLEQESTGFKIHLESAAGDAYTVYLPFEENNGKREYGTLVVEPAARVVFA